MTYPVFPPSPQLLYLSMTLFGMVCVWQLSCSCPLSASSLPLADRLCWHSSAIDGTQFSVFQHHFSHRLKPQHHKGCPENTNSIPARPNAIPYSIPFLYHLELSYCLLGIGMALKEHGLLWALSAFLNIFRSEYSSIIPGNMFWVLIIFTMNFFILFIQSEFPLLEFTFIASYLLLCIFQQLWLCF